MRVSIGPGHTALTRTPLPRHFAGRGLGQADDRVLGRDIGRHPRRRDQPGDRGCIDDGAALLLQHDRQDVAQSKEHALHVHPHHRVEHRFVVFGGRSNAALDAGIVVEAVDRAIGIERRLHVGLHVGGFGDVGRDEQRLAALLANDAGGAFTACRVAIHDDNLGTVPREANGGGTPDAIAGAGDQRDLALEVHGFLQCLSLHAQLSTGASQTGIRAAPPQAGPRRTARRIAPLRSERRRYPDARV